MTRGARFVTLLMTLLLTACVSLPEGQAPPQRYVLRPLAAGQGPPLPARIEVAEPRLPPGLASDRVAVLHGERRLDHFAGARWAAPLPGLLQDFFADSVENRLGAAAWGEVPARYRLVTAVRDFQAEYRQGPGSPPTVRVTVVAVLWDRARGEAVLRQRSADSRKVSANRLGAVTGALEDLLREATGRLLEETARRLGSRQGPGAPG